MKFFQKFVLVIFILLNNKPLFADIVKKIEIIGNERISEQTIIVFSEISLNQELNKNDLNKILKDLYETNFFNDVKILFNDNILQIQVKENPIIINIQFLGIKSNSLKEKIISNLKLREKSSYVESQILDDINLMRQNLKDAGYFFSSIEAEIENLDNNQINLKYNINLGEKAKIRKITFLGDKIFKDRRLRNIIISEEYKFWKFLSNKKFLNENLISFDTRLLKNFYLNQGYYNVNINSSFGKLFNKNEFELIFNIDAKNKVFFNDLKLNLPLDFEKENFNSIYNLFNDIKGSEYSIIKIQKILDKIDTVVLNEQYQSTKAIVNENLENDLLDLTFSIIETEKIFVDKINIFGNNVTSETVIRNQFLLDEGDPFNDILQTKTINNIKSLNFFKDVKSEVILNEDGQSNTININVIEKPTGEIMAGAGFGTSGGTFIFGVKENNFLGNGISLDANLDLSADSIKGQFNVINPNYKNLDKSLSLSLVATEIDKIKDSGYKTTKTGASISTKFEYFDDLYLNLGNSFFLENLETDSTASSRQKKLAGNYVDYFLKFDFDYDKRNQRFQTSDGFRSIYSIDIPIISESYTLVNSYEYKYFDELYEDNISSISFTIRNSQSLNNKDIKLSERLFIPSKLLRGFEPGKIGPKDSDDYIGGNLMSALNFSSTLPMILENSQNTDIVLFLDMANLWGVDYDSSLDDSKIRSSVGIGVDWFTPVGPLNFSLAQPITKSKNDITENFRFNLGTTF